MQVQKDHYGLLGIPPDASEILIKKVYKRLALKYHPDKNSEDMNADLNFKILKEAYDVLADPESRQLYDSRRQAYGFIPTEFLPPAMKPRHPEPVISIESKNEDIKEAFRKARAREKLEAERIRLEKEREAEAEAARLREQEKFQTLAAERIRAARDQQRLEEERRQQARDQERLQRDAAARIRAQREEIARGEARRRAQERRERESREEVNREEEKREEEKREEERKKEEQEQEYAERIRRAEALRRMEEELLERLRNFGHGMKTPKGIAPNNWSEVEIECLSQWKRDGMTWAVIAEKLNEIFEKDRNAISCRRKWVKLERGGETI